MIMEKSANQQWKESETNLSFKEWLQAEQEKGNLEKETPKTFSNKGKTQFLGIDTKWILAGALISSGIFIYYHMKAKK